MPDPDFPSDEEVRNLMFALAWEGPWERLLALFYGIRKDGSLRWEIPADPRGWRWLLGCAGDFCDSRDRAWRNRHRRRGTDPWALWRRHGSVP